MRDDAVLRRALPLGRGLGPRTLKILHVLKVLGKVKQGAKFQRRISMDHAVMHICFCIGFPLCVPKNGVLRVKM